MRPADCRLRGGCLNNAAPLIGGRDRPAPRMGEQRSAIIISDPSHSVCQGNGRGTRGVCWTQRFEAKPRSGEHSGASGPVFCGDIRVIRTLRTSVLSSSPHSAWESDVNPTAVRPASLAVWTAVLVAPSRPLLTRGSQLTLAWALLRYMPAACHLAGWARAGDHGVWGLRPARPQ